MSFKVSYDVQWNGKEAKIIGKKIANVSVFEAGLIIEGSAKALVPKDTGRLRNSITTRTITEKTDVRTPATEDDTVKTPVEEGTAYVGTNVSYGPYQEFGTRKMAAQPFMRPAFDLAQGKVVKVFEKNGRKEFEGYEI